MAGQADGSIIIDTELSSEGFKAGSSELLAAIKSLSAEVKRLGDTLREVFHEPLTPTINTADAEAQVSELEEKIHELEAELEELRNAGASGTAQPPQAPKVDLCGSTQ